MVNAAPVVQLARMLRFLLPSGSQRWCPSLILTAALWENTCICDYEVSMFSPLLPCGWKRPFCDKSDLFLLQDAALQILIEMPSCHRQNWQFEQIPTFDYSWAALRITSGVPNDMWQRSSSARPPTFIHPCRSDEGRHGWGRRHQLGPSITLAAGGNSEDSLG